MPQENINTSPATLYSFIESGAAFSDEKALVSIVCGDAHFNPFRVGDLMNSNLETAIKVVRALETGTRVLPPYGLKGPEALKAEVVLTHEDIACIKAAGAAWLARVCSKSVVAIKS